MKPVTLFTVAVAFCASTLFFHSGAEANDNPQDNPKLDKQTQKELRQNNKAKMKHDKKGMFTRASQLMGVNITNQKNNEVGEIEDLVLSTPSGDIRYAAVTYGGFLGIGDKMFAVPIEAFKIKHKGKDNELNVHLNVTEKQLEGETGFNQDNWPNFADKEFVSALDQRYKVNGKVRKEKKSDKDQADMQMSDHVIRLSQLMDHEIQNTQNQSVGEVSEIVLDTTHHKARYFVVSFNDQLGEKDKLYAVPFQAFMIKTDTPEKNEHKLFLNVTKEQLQGAHGFTEDNWPDFTDAQFQKSLANQFLLDSDVKKRPKKELGT
ncbi:MAG: PRC-barrel domain-containing protein [bacterium]|nr:PRC-barrel domain-containing protein [bacterium]